MPGNLVSVTDVDLRSVLGGSPPGAPDPADTEARRCGQLSYGRGGSRSVRPRTRCRVRGSSSCGR